MLSHNQKVRYSRNVNLPEIGEAGQEKLLGAKVLAIGAGGLGSPLLLYLAAAGIGHIGIADGDRVELSNLQRQILYEEPDTGQWKADTAAQALSGRNPDINVTAHRERITVDNIDRIAEGYDIVADGSDNFDTRFLISDYCMRARKTLVSAAIVGFTGQLSVFKPYLGPPHPCYRCLYHGKPPAEIMPSCAEYGVLGAVAGVMGAWQATEVVKEILGIGKSLSGHLLLFDGLAAHARAIVLPRDPACPGCGTVDRHSSFAQSA